MDSHSITLPTKPGATLSIHTYTPPSNTPLPHPLSNTLLIFLNGLAAPQTSWHPTISLLQSHPSPILPHILTYDRYGQGTSSPDPTDAPATPYGHDVDAVIADLHALITQVCASIFHLPIPGPDSPTRLLFVANSIGCPIARLYAASHPGTVAGYLFLDSMIANSNFVSIHPDPDAEGFDPKTLPEGVSVEDLRYAREQYGKYFHPTVPNGEKFDRRDMPHRLPHADRPMLPKGPGGDEPVVRVVGHDFARFARDGEDGFMHIPTRVTEAYMNPAWHVYNQGLCRLSTREGNPKEPIIAPGCGHVVQKDSPEFVADQIVEILEELARVK